ncbi:MAG: hypothetical protein ACI9YT_002694 [Halobacteriales archaeon]
MRVDARTVRIAVLVTVVVFALPSAGGFVAHYDSTHGADVTTPSGDVDGSDVTRTTRRSPEHLAYVIDAAGPAQLTVVNRTTGTTVFKTTDHEVYHDVDPSPAGETTLMYVASDVRGEAVCPEPLATPCTHNVIERINYSTGETEQLYGRFLNYSGSSQTHDVARISSTEYLVGDIKFDRIFVVNVETDAIEWTWNVSSAYDRSTGGQPGDWTHLNDVEVLDEDLYMVNLRNQDQVVFVHRDRGLLENWTLGTDDDYETLYEPHNPDYIPAENGGPAILIADSENDRVVEYQRRNGSWERTWKWTDETLQWPRDADRLPNNNTLIADTHGTRILEVRPNGSVARVREVPRGVYDVELLSTGPESAGGNSMARIRGATNDSDVSSVRGLDRVQKAFLDRFPPLVLHGFLFVLPTWVSPTAGALLLVDVAVVVLWIVGEGVRFGLVRYRAE